MTANENQAAKQKNKFVILQTISTKNEHRINSSIVNVARRLFPAYMVVYFCHCFRFFFIEYFFYDSLASLA